MLRSDREVLEEALGYQRLTQGMQGRIARVLRGGVDDLLDRMAELCGRYGREIGDPAGAARWLSSMWGPYDEEWLSKYADSLPEPLRGRWEAVLRAPRFDRAISRRKAMAYASRMCMDRIEHGVKEVSGPPLGRVAREASMRTAHQVQTSAGVGFSFELPNQGQIERVMRSSGISKQIKGFSQANVELVEDRVVRGLLAGASIDDVAAGIRRDFRDMSPARARRIARTMTTDCAAEAKLREYGELGVEEYEIMCTLDERTCPTCGSMDGKAFPVKGGHPRPSFHPNCRCVIVERLPKDWTEKMTRAARDERGKTVQVPRSMTYGEWKAKFAKPAPVRGGPSKAEGGQKASEPAQGKKTRQRPAVVQGNGSPAQAQAQPVQEANRSAQNPDSVPAAPRTEAARGKDPGTQAPKDPFEGVDDDIVAYSAVPQGKDHDGERKKILTDRFEGIKASPPSYTVEAPLKRRPKVGDPVELSKSTNALVKSGGITAEAQDAILRYTQGSDYLNRPLYDTDGYLGDMSMVSSTPRCLSEGVDDTRLLDEAISKGKIEKAVTIHRGVTKSVIPGLSLDEITPNKAGREWVSDSYSSGTTDLVTAESFGSGVLLIHYAVPESTGVGLYVGDGAYRSDGGNMSQYPDEMEYLMKRGLRLKLTEVKDKASGLKEIWVNVIPAEGDKNGQRGDLEHVRNVREIQTQLCHHPVDDFRHALLQWHQMGNQRPFNPHVRGIKEVQRKTGSCRRSRIPRHHRRRGGGVLQSPRMRTAEHRP